MNFALSPEEIFELTGKRRSSAQSRALTAMGIAHRRRRDGSVACLRIHVETLQGAPAAPSATLPPEPTLVLDGL